jgi:hypothetical protein
MTALALPPGYTLKPTGLYVDRFEAKQLRFNNVDTGRGFLTPPTQADIDLAIELHKRDKS